MAVETMTPEERRLLTLRPPRLADPRVLRVAFLLRLERLLRVKRMQRKDLNHEGMALLLRAIYVTVGDLRSVGAGDDARDILRRWRRRGRR
jgi:hypothetical protein